MPAPDPKSVSKNHLINKDRKKYDSIVAGLKEGRGMVQLASEVGVAPSTVQLIREDHRDELPNWKRRTVKALSEASEAIAQSLVEGHENIPWSQKALSLGIILTKKQELEGSMPQQKVVHEHRITHDSLVDKFKQMKKVVDIDSETYAKPTLEADK
tara:strand:+ start:175 stop:642 length:468 start_codon:yes stop_codon:yes gene_type:complete